MARKSDAAAKAAGLVELAEIFRDKLQRDDKALSILRQAQRADKSIPAIYKSMASIFEAQGRPDQAQTSMLAELEIGGANDGLLDRLGQLAQRLLDRPKLHALARVVVDAVLQNRAGDQQATLVGKELDTFESAWSLKVADLVQRASEVGAQDRAAAADFWLTVAEIQLVYGKQAEAALGSLDKVMAGRPGHPSALRLMEEIYGSENRYEDLALKMEMMASYARETQVAVDLFLKAAMHYAVRLDNPEAAATVHERVLEMDPGNKISSNALAEYYREAKRLEDALHVLSAWAEKATQANDKVAAHYACCRILEEEMGDLARARPHYEAILVLDPENQAAARALEAVYREAGDHAALATTLRAKLAGARDDDRPTILTELGQMYAGPLDKPDEALEICGELYRLAPEAKLRESLEELAARAGAFAQLVQILEAGLGQIESEADKVQAMHSIAALYEGVREAPLEALRIHRRILAMVPNDERAKVSVERLMQSAAESGDKIAFYQEQATAAGSNDERVSILHKLALELVNTAKDYVRASDIYRQILKLQPGDRTATDGLLSLYRRDNRWAEVVDMLMAKVEQVTETSQRIPIQLELGQILEERLNQADRAVDWYRAAFDQAPGNQTAIAGLERLLTRAKQVEMIAEILQPHYRTQGRWDRAAAMMEIRGKASMDATTRAELLRGLAEVYEVKLDKKSEALAVLLRAFQADPSDSGLQVDLERLAGELGDFTGLIRAYRGAGSTVEGDQRVAMLQRAGSLAEKAGDQAGALVDYLRLLGASDAGSKASTDGLARLLQNRLTPEALRDAAMQISRGLEEPQTTEYWRKLARFYEQTMNSPNDAIAAWKAVLQAHVNDPEATAELDRLYQTTDDPVQLVEHLRAKLAAAADDTARASLGGQIALVIADKLGDVDGAITQLNEVAELAPGQRLVWQQLVTLYTGADRLQDAAGAMHKELGLLPDGDERYTRLVEYAELLGRLGDMPTATQALQGLLTQAPTHAGAIAVLEQLAAANPDPDSAVAVADMMLAGYLATERWQDAIKMLSSRIEGTDDVEQRAAALREIATLKSDKLNDAAGAYVDLERAFRELPTDPEIRASLERTAEAAGAWEQLAEAYQAAIGVMSDASVQQALERKLAEVLDQKLGRGAEAIQHFKAATGGQLPDDLDALESMERLLREQNQLPELADVLYAIVVKVSPEETERRTHLLFELGTICEETLGDESRAVESYKQIIEIKPKDTETSRRLEALYDGLGRPEERAAMLESLVALGTGNAQLVDDLLKLAQVEVQLGKLDDAVKHYR
ncbi:MAG: hypothetical protein V3T05_14200, partial [Myxococcota bacterium]